MILDSLLLLLPLLSAHAPGTPLPAAELWSRPAQDPPAGKGDELARLDTDELVRRGRRLVRDGRPDEALAFLEEADRRSGGDPGTRVWWIRCMLARGFLNDGMDATDALAAGGFEGPALDYLYGLALHARGKQYIAEQVGGGLIELNFSDAVEFLKRATAADPVEFADALLPLAEAAWYGQDLAVARSAAERAVAARPEGFEEAYLLGRIALSQFIATRGDGGPPDELEAHWQVAFEALARAARNAGRPEDPALRNLLAQTHLQSAYALVWKERTDEVPGCFALAMSWDPSVVSYRDLWNYMGPEEVLACLEQGARGFVQNHGEESTLDASLQWWLGWAHFSQKHYAEAERAYGRAVAKWPGFVDSHWYVGLSRYHQQDFSGAIDALVDGWEQGRDQIIQAATPQSELNLAILDYLVGRCSQATPPRNLEAARLSGLQAALAPENPKYWNNVGFFCRDAGNALRDAEQPAARAQRQDLYEKALVAYERALELAPDDPAYLNDAAVVLHYCLRRDLERAETMYRRAHERAAEELARTDLPDELRRLYEKTRDDSQKNLKRIEEGRGGGK